MSTPTIEGVVVSIDPGRRFGFVRGDDGHQYFIIPSFMSPPRPRLSLAVDERVIGEPFHEPGRGMRLRNVRSVSVRQD